MVENADKDPTAPTLVWLQGGPGGSSLIGLLTENGPLTLNDYSVETEAFNKTQIPTVFDNRFSWHNVPANMLYVEHPAPTGFSYCDPGPCYWDDTSQVRDTGEDESEERWTGKREGGRETETETERQSHAERHIHTHTHTHTHTHIHTGRDERPCLVFCAYVYFSSTLTTHRA